MSQPGQDYIGWLYNLFSQLVPYWDSLANIRRLIEPQQIANIVKDWLAQEGCNRFRKYIYVSAYTGNLYMEILQCGNTYVRLGSVFACRQFFQDEEKGSRKSFYPSAVGLYVNKLYVYICDNEVSVNLHNQKVILDSAILVDHLLTGELTIDFTLYLLSTMTIDFFPYPLSTEETSSFTVFVSPTKIRWEFYPKEKEERMKKMGLTVPDILLAIYNNEETRVTFEDNVKKFIEIASKIPHVVATYLLY
jgi:hypothetical protein